MKISLNILKDYVDLQIDSVDELVAQITEKTAEVDEVEVQGELLRNCCVGRIKTLQKHPDADKLQVCTVETDKGDKPIVCGGTNLHVGMCIAFAHVGAKVKTAKGELFELGAIKIRGEQSEGMICANVELGVEDMYPESPEDGERPVINLGAADAHIGEPLQEYFGLNDTIIHIDNHAITHRPDLFSIVGFARELVAMGLATWKKQPEVAVPNFGSESLPFKMQVSNPELMPRYVSCVIKIDSIGETPAWMKTRLASVGVRSVNLPVDITNYVLVEYGLPLHCFDADDIVGSVTMRPAHADEVITTLDGTERTLSEGALILEDEAGIFDLLGIMGGLRSATKADSTRLYIHAASLDPVSIRKAMIAMGHRTDAGTVYEKGVQPFTVEQGFYRTLELFLQLVPGAKIVSQSESVGQTPAMNAVDVSLPKVAQKLGVDLEANFIRTTLENLGFSIAETSADVWQITPPLWRRDCTGAHDILEEIARMYGYNSINPIMPSASIVPPPRTTAVQTIRTDLKALSYLEILPLSLVGPKLLTATGFDPSEAVVIDDPIGEELSMLQPSVLPQMLDHVSKTLGANEPVLQTHTKSHVFSSLWPEFTQFGAVVARVKVTTLLNEPLYMLQQQVQTAFAEAGYTVTFEPATTIPPYAHNGRCADVLCNNEVIGQVFQVHPKVIASCDIKGTVAACLCNFDQLLAMAPVVTIAESMAAYPAITYDETLTQPMSESVSMLLTNLRNQHELLESVDVVDVYAKELPAEQYQLTLRFTYRSQANTLKEAEIKPVHEQVMSTVRSS